MKLPLHFGKRLEAQLKIRLGPSDRVAQRARASAPGAAGVAHAGREGHVAAQRGDVKFYCRPAGGPHALAGAAGVGEQGFSITIFLNGVGCDAPRPLFCLFLTSSISSPTLGQALSAAQFLPNSLFLFEI